MIFKENKSAGFTIVELMIALVISSLVMGGLILTFIKQGESKSRQDDVTDILQNSRVLRMLIADDLRMAGYYDASVAKTPNDLALYDSSTGLPNPTPTALSANALTTRYWDDQPTYGTAGIKTVDYRLRDGADSDTLPDDLGWTNSNLAAPGNPNVRDLIGNIDGLEFFYTLNDGTTAVNTKTTTPTVDQIKDIKAVTITILLRGRSQRKGTVDTKVYRTPSGNTFGFGGIAKRPFDDNFKRRLFTFTVSCRNMELHYAK